VIAAIEASRAKSAQLHEGLREELTAQMEAAGWAVDVAQDSAPGGRRVAAFRRPISDDFCATAEFLRTSFDGPDWAPLEVTAVVGVSYGPAYRLWPLVCDRETPDLTIDVGELLDPPQDVSVDVARPADAHRAAAELIAPVLAYGLPYAERHADVDALIAQSKSDPDEYGWQAEVVPLLLAAAGRSDEARGRLAEYMASGRSEVAGHDYRRFAYQLHRWLDAGAVLPDPPSAPVTDRPVFESPSAPLPSFSDVRRSAAARREAFDVVRGRSNGLDRSQRRKMLIEELGRRKIALSPLAVEAQLDAMELGPGRRAGRGLKLLAGLGSGVRKVIRDGVADPPEWLQPPPRASYPARTGHRDWVAVALDGDAGAWLDRVMVAAPNRINDTTTVTSWLAWDPEPRTPDSRLAVHIGAPRVGIVDLAATKRFEPVMEAAERRQELPWIRSRLTSIGDGARHLLELPSP